MSSALLETNIALDCILPAHMACASSHLCLLYSLYDIDEDASIHSLVCMEGSHHSIVQGE